LLRVMVFNAVSSPGGGSAVPAPLNSSLAPPE
jgi:hypothetical protein